MGVTLVNKRINCPHDSVFTADDKQVVYSDLTAIVRGYLMVLGMEMDMKVKAHMSQHLEELMDDTDLYGWIRVWSFHAAWLNQIELGRSSWGDIDHQLWLHRNLVRHAAMLDHTSAPSSAPGAKTKPAIPLKIYNAPAAPGTKACDNFNLGIKCFSNEDHPDSHNICSYFLTTINRAFPHTDLTCNIKKLAQGKTA